jgi:hypothetical protein
MGNVIELYVRYAKIPVGTGVTYDQPGHQCAKAHTIAVSEKTLAEADQATLDLCKMVAAERDLRMRVYDVSKISGKLTAWRNQVKETPTVIIEGNKIDGTITKKRLLAAI